MSHDHNLLNEVAPALKAIGSALAPSVLGATVSQAWKKGLSFGERLVQILVGIVVSYFVGLFVEGMFHPDPFVGQAVGFVIAMMAYEATPKFIQNASEVVGNLPAEIRDRFFPRKGGDK